MKYLILIISILLCGCTHYPVERTVIIDEASGLEGVLVIPSNLCDTGVVLLCGSGAADRDYTLGNVKIYRDLSESLAEHGIASLRMDKRNLAADKQMMSMQEEILDDALSAIELLKNEVDTVFVLGHSLAAIVLPALHDEADGLILLAGSVSGLEEIYALQLMKQADDKEKERIQEELDIIQRLHEDSGFSWFGLPESWWISLADLNLEQCLKSMTVPVLVMHGSLDEQIDCIELEHYREILSCHPDAEFVLWEGFDHYLMKENSLHMDDSVIHEIVTWILTRS